MICTLLIINFSYFYNFELARQIIRFASRFFSPPLSNSLGAQCKKPFVICNRLKEFSKTLRKSLNKKPPFRQATSNSVLGQLS